MKLPYFLKVVCLFVRSTVFMFFLHVRFHLVLVCETELWLTCSVRFGKNSKTVLWLVTIVNMFGQFLSRNCMTWSFWTNSKYLAQFVSVPLSPCSHPPSLHLLLILHATFRPPPKYFRKHYDKYFSKTTKLCKGDSKSNF